MMVRNATELHVNPRKIAESVYNDILSYFQVDLSEEADHQATTIINYVSQEMNVTTVHMKSHSRKREYSEARQIAQYVLCMYTSMSLSAIGRYFGGRDHSTIIHARDTVRDLMRSDRKFREKCAKCITFAEQLLYNNDQQDQKPEADNATV